VGTISASRKSNYGCWIYPKTYLILYSDENQVKLDGIGTIMMIALPMLLCTIATIFLMSESVAAFAYHTSSIIAYPQTEPTLGALYNYVVSSSNSSEQQLIPQQPQSKMIEAFGHFANNLIENASVSWVQGGLWHLAIYNSSSSSSSPNSTNSAKATFSANFTMVKPDGSETHDHSVRDFTSDNVIIAGGDMIITGIGNIYENAELKYRGVPITVHLMGKEHVLGLIIDTVKTDRHFASNHEMYGTLINGTGLEKIEKTLPQQKNSKGMNMNGMTM
jgi:hypothetical protein